MLMSHVLVREEYCYHRQELWRNWYIFIMFFSPRGGRAIKVAVLKPLAWKYNFWNPVSLARKCVYEQGVKRVIELDPFKVRFWPGHSSSKGFIISTVHKAHQEVGREPHWNGAKCACTVPIHYNGTCARELSVDWAPLKSCLNSH